MIVGAQLPIHPYVDLSKATNAPTFTTNWIGSPVCLFRYGTSNSENIFDAFKNTYSFAEIGLRSDGVVVWRYRQ